MIDTIHLVNPVQSCKSCLTRRLTLSALTRIVSRFGPKVWKQQKQRPVGSVGVEALLDLEVSKVV